MKKKKVKNRPRNSGVIIGFLNRLNDAVMTGLKSGIFSKIFAGGDMADDLTAKSLALGHDSARPEGRRRSVRRDLLTAFDRSAVLGAVRRTKTALLACKLNVFGAYLMSFGICAMIAFCVKYFAVEDHVFDKYMFAEMSFWMPLIILLFSLPLIATSRSISVLFRDSAIIRGVFEDELGIAAEKFIPVKRNDGKAAYTVAAVLGVLSGGVSYFVYSETVILLLIAMIGVWVVMSVPETGVLITIAMTPLLGFLNHPTAILAVTVGVTLVSFFFKVAVGKRYVKFRITDIFVAAFALLMMMGGIVTSGGRESFRAATVYFVLMLVYFLVVNLMNTREWLARCADAVALPSAVVATFGILNYASVTIPGGWLDAAMFSSISSRAVSTFENPNVLATYLIMTAPFLWIKLADKDSGSREKIFALLGSVASLVCVVLTWSRGGWIGYLAGLLVYLLIRCRYTLKYLLCTGLVLPLCYFAIPKNVIARFASIGNLNDSSTYYRLLTWKGSLRMFADNLIGGVGVGTSAFNQMYPFYSYIGTEAAAHSHNLLLQIGLELGVVGLAVFVVIMFGVARSGFGGLKRATCRGSRLILSAGMAAMAAAMAHGLVDYIWYNYRVFFIFWAVAALICACARVEANDLAYKASPTGDEDGESVLKIVFREG